MRKVRIRGDPHESAAPPLLVAILLAVIVWLAARVPGALLDLFEQGHWLGPASDMLAGKVPYRDTFPIHGFLSDGGLDYFLFQAAGANFATSVNARQFLGSWFQPAIFLVAAAASRRPMLAIAAIPLNLGMSTAIIADRPVLPLLSLATFAWAIGERRSKPAAFVAGALASVGLLYALEFGLYVLAAELITLLLCGLVSRPRACFIDRTAFLGGLGAVLIPWFALLAAWRALGPFLRVSFWDLPVRFHSMWPMPFPGPGTVFRELASGRADFLKELGVSPDLARRLYLAPLIGTLGVATALWHRARGGSPVLSLRLLVVSLASLAFFRSVVARFHVEAGNALAGPVLFLILVAASELFRNRRWARIAFASVGLLVVLALSGPSRVFAVFRGATQFRRRTAVLPWTVPLDVPRGGGIRVPRDEEQNLRALIDFTEQHAAPKAPILDLSNRPSLYFFTRRVNPTRFYQVPPMAAFEDEVLRSIQARRPALVLLRSGGWLDAIDGVPNSRRIPRVWSWVLDNYPMRAKVGDTIVALPADAE
ncbi:MAG TPA: hypothetical protein VGK70_08045 [Thermoanaerobaculia bacterium]